MKIIIAVLVIAAAAFGGLYIYSGQMTVDREQVSVPVQLNQATN